MKIFKVYRTADRFDNIIGKYDLEEIHEQGNTANGRYFLIAVFHVHSASDSIFPDDGSDGFGAPDTSIPCRLSMNR